MKKYVIKQIIYNNYIIWVVSQLFLLKFFKIKCWENKDHCNPMRDQVKMKEIGGIQKSSPPNIFFVQHRC